MVGATDPLDATLGRRNDIVKGVAGKVGQLHRLETGPQRLSRFATVRGSVAKRV